MRTSLDFMLRERKKLLERRRRAAKQFVVIYNIQLQSLSKRIIAKQLEELGLK